MATLDMKAKELQKNFEQIIYQFQTVAAESVKDTDNLKSERDECHRFYRQKGKMYHARDFRLFTGCRQHGYDIS